MHITAHGLTFPEKAACATFRRQLPRVSGSNVISKSERLIQETPMPRDISGWRYFQIAQECTYVGRIMRPTGIPISNLNILKAQYKNTDVCKLFVSRDYAHTFVAEL